MTDDVNANVDQPEAAPERGFVINEKLYPFPSSFKVTDPVLVKEVSGLSWDPFIAAATGDEEWLTENGAPDEAIVMVGLIACAVWHVNPRWPRAAVVRFVQNLDEGDLDVVGADLPPEVSPGEAPPSATTVTSTGPTPELPLESEQLQD